ncbi:MAG: hypothetical protein ACRCYA_00280 [Cetobacterium sp.]|uniref:hypothetical protein n=1 Tax=Cetobacterium sp. TaxID=2071632 RepID=UPI003F2C207F
MVNLQMLENIFNNGWGFTTFLFSAFSIKYVLNRHKEDREAWTNQTKEDREVWLKQIQDERAASEKREDKFCKGLSELTSAFNDVNKEIQTIKEIVKK